MSWTDDRVALLKTLWADGFSASLIAGRIGEVTRNAVIGKVRRLGLPARGTTSRRVQPANPRSSLSARTRSSCPRRVPPRLTRQPPVRPRARRRRAAGVPELGPAPSFPVTVLALTDAICRWPEGDPKRAGFHFCGRVKGETPGPYCGHHAALAYTPLR